MAESAGIILMGIIFAPLLPGVVSRTKAFFAGRKGQPVLQNYYDILKLFRKSAVYSRTTSLLFIAGPISSLSCMLIALALVPFGGTGAFLSFGGDFILLLGLFALARFFTAIAALDTGSSFEGMGASREAYFSVFAEPALFLVLVTVHLLTGSFSLSSMPGGLSAAFAPEAPAFILATVSLFMLFLAENCRIPVDDPNTHLELTMIHEVMALDHSGPDFAFISYAACLKFWALGAVLTGIAVPYHPDNLPVRWTVAFCGMLALAALTGIVESVMARLRLSHVPRMLIGSAAISLIAIFLVLRHHV